MTKLMSFLLDSFHFESRLEISWEPPEDEQSADGRQVIGDRSFNVLPKENE